MSSFRGEKYSGEKHRSLNIFSLTMTMAEPTKDSNAHGSPSASACIHGAIGEREDIHNADSNYYEFSGSCVCDHLLFGAWLDGQRFKSVPEQAQFGHHFN